MASSSLHFAFPLILCLCFFSLLLTSNVKFTYKQTSALYGATRKLLQINDSSGGTSIEEPGCSKNDIKVSQDVTGPLPSGIPTFTVQILNTCSGGCPLTDIHLSCGWFGTARLVDPKVFRRIAYDNCLVNDGKPMYPGDALSFLYANSFSYDMHVKTAKCA